MLAALPALAFGAVTARDLMKRFHELPVLRATAEKANAGDAEALSELTAIEGVGPVVVEALGERRGPAQEARGLYSQMDAG